MRTWMYLMLVVLLSAGCTTTGTKINRDNLSKIQEGVTTRSEIIALFGKPNTVEFTPERKPILKYRYFKYQSKASGFVPFLGWVSSGVDTEEEILHVILGKHDIVETFIFDEAISDIDTGLVKGP